MRRHSDLKSSDLEIIRAYHVGHGVHGAVYVWRGRRCSSIIGRAALPSLLESMLRRQLGLPRRGDVVLDEEDAIVIARRFAAGYDHAEIRRGFDCSGRRAGGGDPLRVDDFEIREAHEVALAEVWSGGLVEVGVGVWIDAQHVLTLRDILRRREAAGRIRPRVTDRVRHLATPSRLAA